MGYYRKAPSFKELAVAMGTLVGGLVMFIGAWLGLLLMFLPIVLFKGLFEWIIGKFF